MVKENIKLKIVMLHLTCILISVLDGANVCSGVKWEDHYYRLKNQSQDQIFRPITSPTLNSQSKLSNFPEKISKRWYIVTIILLSVFFFVFFLSCIILYKNGHRDILIPKGTEKSSNDTITSNNEIYISDKNGHPENLKPEGPTIHGGNYSSHLISQHSGDDSSRCISNIWEKHDPSKIHYQNQNPSKVNDDTFPLTAIPQNSKTSNANPIPSKNQSRQITATGNPKPGTMPRAKLSPEGKTQNYLTINLDKIKKKERQQNEVIEDSTVPDWCDRSILYCNVIPRNHQVVEWWKDEESNAKRKASFKESLATHSFYMFSDNKNLKDFNLSEMKRHVKYVNLLKEDNQVVIGKAERIQTIQYKKGKDNYHSNKMMYLIKETLFVPLKGKTREEKSTQSNSLLDLELGNVYINQIRREMGVIAMRIKMIEEKIIYRDKSMNDANVQCQIKEESRPLQITKLARNKYNKNNDESLRTFFGMQKYEDMKINHLKKLQTSIEQKKEMKPMEAKPSVFKEPGGLLIFGIGKEATSITKEDGKLRELILKINDYDDTDEVRASKEERLKYNPIKDMEVRSKGAHHKNSVSSRSVILSSHLSKSDNNIIHAYLEFDNNENEVSRQVPKNNYSCRSDSELTEYDVYCFNDPLSPNKNKYNRFNDKADVSAVSQKYCHGTSKIKNSRCPRHRHHSLLKVERTFYKNLK